MGFFLTYPQCSLTPPEVLELLKKCHVTPIKHYIVAQEEHKLQGLHIHAWIQYEKKITFTTTLWDISGFHGHYEIEKCQRRVMEYCAKDGNFIANVDVVSAKQKKASRNFKLLHEDSKQLIDSGEIGLFQLESLEKAKAIYSTIGSSYDHFDVRGVWVYGLAGVGKSHFVRSLYRDDQLYVKPANQWFNGYSGHQVILLEDFDHSTVGLSHYLKIWADKWSCRGEIKGAYVNLRHTTFYVTSQYLIDDLFPGNHQQELRDALNRRFRTIGLSKGYGEPIIPEGFDN